MKYEPNNSYKTLTHIPENNYTTTEVAVNSYVSIHSELTTYEVIKYEIH